MIAMALACRPKLIVADEPTTALDVMVQAQILDLLRDLVRDLDVGALFISHDLSVLADVCDRVLVMYAGRVVESGTAEQVFTDPLHPYTRALSGAFPRSATRRRATRRPGWPETRRTRATCRRAARSHPRCPRAVDECTAPSRRWSRCARAGRWPASGWVSRDRADEPALLEAAACWSSS
jgi:peptide/nickel transport system ATP-binding protein